MNGTVRRLLEGQEENRVLPFFWQHGEDEATLRKMMAVIHGANCRAVCVESRPHPDFCGPKWWQDMDIILDEARRRGMKVWILDDSHFPTGFANGALKGKPDSLCRQSIFLNTAPVPPEAGRFRVNLKEEGLMKAPVKKPANMMEARWFSIPPARSFDDDRVIRAALRQNGEDRDLTPLVSGETLEFEKPAGAAELRILTASRNAGYHRDYINMTDRDSVRVLIDAVYEPHWQHYREDFGRTIAGFFSDEPELGNGFMYDKENPLGTRQDLPWGREMEAEAAEALGRGWKARLERLWDLNTDPETARVHFLYMDCLTRLVRRNFSEQIGAWCREHGVMYIGHVIEDDGHHCRTGSSLGHYFRGLEGQDMAGIDDIGGQVLPQGEDQPLLNDAKLPRNGTFHHYGLSCLARSAAALEPRKAGRAMCEIFGNYGWGEGVRLEKYLADHFLVRGINYFVPHAFTGAPFPDPDCPPHFYAGGHNPQYRHFGRLMAYMNRAAALTSSGRHQVSAAVLYHGEAEWCDPEAMPFEQPVRKLYDAQVDCMVIPADFLADPERTRINGDGTFSVNERIFRVMIVPGSESVCAAAAETLDRMAAAGVPVFFAGRKPAFVSETGKALPDALEGRPVLRLEELAETVRGLGFPLPEISPADNRIRLLEIRGETPVLMIVNEGTEPWKGRVQPSLPMEGGFLYDAYENRCRPLSWGPSGAEIEIHPLKSLFLIGGVCDALLGEENRTGEEIPLAGWRRSLCEGAEYPRFSAPEETCVPDGGKLAEEKPEFSGFVRYECEFDLPERMPLALRVEDAEEGLEVFLNGESAGLQIVPPFEYALQGASGRNRLRIEVATTLERECYPLLQGHRKLLADPPARGSGLTGRVRLYRRL